MKVRGYNRFLWEAQTNKAKLDYLIKNLSPLVFKQLF